MPDLSSQSDPEFNCGDTNYTGGYDGEPWQDALWRKAFQAELDALVDMYAYDGLECDTHGDMPTLLLDSDPSCDDADWALQMGPDTVVSTFDGSEMACGARDASRDGAGSGKSAVLDSGATRHIFNDMSVFDKDYNPMGGSTFSVVQNRPVSSAGSGTVHFAKTDLVSGKVVGLRLRDAHLIPGQPFNLISVVALEDAGFCVDFPARTISNGGATFSFSREGKQYIIREDSTGALDTFMACGAHEDPPPRDKTDWRFEDADTHFETHGPFNLELFADKDNHLLPAYCTTTDSCFDKDWAGKACYGNPPFEHDLILQCLQKALRDHARQPSTTKFLLVLPKWVTATWWDLTKQFTVIHEYPEGSRIFSAPLQSCYNTDDLEHCGDDRVWICDTKWPVVILYKDGHTVAQLDRKLLQHVRLGHICDKSMHQMMEEGVPLASRRQSTTAAR
ncbi:hypothetical protein CYMTET_47192 [Cymbomonas tetramitiformis]|uniref:Retrovirus-related Pol polyprotein from transposon TNT 1-94-like beta-barrel domain-containing protein n=1 Tax=Cymbomonas tetramitiformis TaxID=36881 RepID=A0AAE0BWG6_9CHLO|nr:hypothetical protein CYMTET_47192 [Cymbomonas tetramitiformis]